MGISSLVKCPLCNEQIKAMVEPTPGKEPDLNHVVCIVLALHICKDAKIRDTIKNYKALVEQVKNRLESLPDELGTYIFSHCGEYNNDGVIDAIDTIRKILQVIEEFEKGKEIVSNKPIAPDPLFPNIEALRAAMNEPINDISSKQLKEIKAFMKERNDE